MNSPGSRLGEGHPGRLHAVLDLLPVLAFGAGQIHDFPHPGVRGQPAHLAGRREVRREIHHFDARQRRRQGLDLAEKAADDLYAVGQSRLSRVHGQCPHVIGAQLEQFVHHPAAHIAGSAGDQDLHYRAPYGKWFP
jgi:hypothetical protein